MKLFEVKTSLSIVWDSNFSVYGIVYKKSKNKGKGKLESYFSCDDQNIPFTERLKKVYTKLDGNTKERILIGGYCRSGAVFTLDVPSLAASELKNYLSFELSRHIPYPVESIEWWIRPIKFSQTNAKLIEKIRVFTIFKNEWEELLNFIMKGEIKLDAVVYPFLIADTWADGKQLYMPSIDTQFYYCGQSEFENPYMKQSSNETNNIISKDEIAEIYSLPKQFPIDKYFPALLLANYSMTENFKLDIDLTGKIPKNVRPKRLTSLKLITAVLSIIFVVNIGTYMYRVSSNKNRVLENLTAVQNRLNRAINTYDNKLSIGKELNDSIQKLISAMPNDINLVDYLNYFANNLPMSAWMTNFNSYSNNVNVTIQTKDANPSSLLNSFYQSTLFTVQNNRAQKGMNNMNYIYLNLTQNSNTQNLSEL